MSEQQEQKNYAKGVWIYEKTFQSTGNTIWNFQGNAQEFAEWIMSIADENGKFRLGMSARRERIEKKPTHTLWQDTWRPQQRTERPAERQQDAPAMRPLPQSTETPAADNLPF